MLLKTTSSWTDWLPTETPVSFMYHWYRANTCKYLSNPKMVRMGHFWHSKSVFFVCTVTVSWLNKICFLFFFFFWAKSFYFYFYLFIYFLKCLPHSVFLSFFFFFFTLQYCIGFAIHQHETSFQNFNPDSTKAVLGDYLEF